MKKIYFLTDYLNRFGSKHNSLIYKDGMDKDELSKQFFKYGFELVTIPLNKISFQNQEWNGKVVLYSSQEDVGLFYKNFIEDIVYGLELAGARIVPSYRFLRAHSNKVFMEVLRELNHGFGVKEFSACYYGTIEEAMREADGFDYPVVVKGAEGAMSKNVALAKNKKELQKKIKSLAATPNLKEEAREFIRGIKYSGYQRQSKYRRKFIIQKYLPELKNDWKVLVFGEKYYIVERNVRKNDFRASGGGLNKFGEEVNIPEGIFKFASIIKEKLNVPMVSLDIARYKNQFYLIEFQALYFGTSGHWKSEFYYIYDGDELKKMVNNLTFEELFAETIVEHLKCL